MSQKKSVDEIWKELNAKPIHRPRPAAEGGAGSITIPGLGIIKRVPPPPKTSLTADALVEDVPITGNAAQAASTVPTRILQNYDPQQAGVTQEQLSNYLSSIQRLVNCLSDPDRSTRRQAASTLQTKLIQGDSSTPAAEPGMLQALVSGPLLSPLLGLLRDVVEQCRVVALALWTHVVAHVLDVSPLVPHLVPELARRMGHLPVQEVAEEVRLGITQLLSSLAARSPQTLLMAALPDVALVLCRSQEDQYHEIKKAGAAAVATISRALPLDALQPHGSKIATGLVSNLSHPHFRVRVATLEALDVLVGRGGLPAGSLHDLVAPGLRPVAYDRAPAVRDVLFASLARWLGGGAGDGAGGDTGVVVPLNEQSVVALLPILLVGVTDPQETVAAGALAWVERVGDAHKRHVVTGTEGVTDDAMQVDGPVAGPGAEAGVVGCGDVAMAPVGGGDVDKAVAACQLGSPWHGRPGEGARGMARALLPTLLPPVVSDLTGWTVAQRAAAVRSLHTLLVLAEDAVQAHLTALLPALCSAVADEDVEVAGCVVRCAHVVGAHVKPNRWLPLMMDHLVNSRLSAAARANSLVVLAALLHSAGSAHQPLPTESLHALATTLASDDVRGVLLSSIHGTGAAGPGASGQLAGAAGAVVPGEAAAARTQLLAVACNLMRWQGSACGVVAGPLLTLLLSLWGAEGDEGQGQGGAAAVAAAAVGAGSRGVARRQAVEGDMQRLVACCGLGSVQELLAEHAQEQLKGALSSMSSWTPDSGGFLVLRGLLLLSGTHTLAQLAPVLLPSLHPLLADHEGPATLRLAVLQLLDAVLDAHDARGAGLAGEFAGQLLLEKALLPPLTWRAGKTAAAIRYAAVTALASSLRRHLLPSKVLMRLINDGTLIPILAQELDEDWYMDVRHAACYVVEQLLLLVGPRLGHDPRRSIYIELLKRLDDSSNTVRIAACRALHAFCTTMQSDYCETNAGYLAAGVVIHMDDADVQVQEAACSVLEALGRVKPEPTAIEVLKVRDRFRNRHCCERVLQVCGETAIRQPKTQQRQPERPAADSVALEED